MVPEGIYKTLGKPQNVNWFNKNSFEYFNGAVNGVTGVMRASIPLFFHSFKNYPFTIFFASQTLARSPIVFPTL